MKKLLIVTELFHPSIGGMEIRYLELAGVFIDNGWAVDVVTIGADDISPDREMLNGISVMRLERNSAYKRPNARLRRNPIAIAKFAWKVRQHIRSQRYDIVIFNIWPLLPQLFASIPRGTVAMVDWCEHRSNSFWPAINHLQARATVKHMSVSEGVGEKLRARYGIQDIACVPSGIFTRNYRTSVHKQGVLFFGRLASHKRPEEAIQAVIRARELGFTEHLTVAGTGPEAEPLLARYGHLDFIRFAGRVSDSEKYQLLAEHRLLLLPSIREGFPITVVEAMASGTPTITTAHPDNGTVDIVRQYGCGVVVQPGPEAIAGAIINLVSNQTEWLRFSRQGLERSAELDWQHVFGTLLEHAEGAARVSV